MVIMPTVVGYDICDYTYKGLGQAFPGAPQLKKDLAARTITVIHEYGADELEAARKHFEGTDFFIQYKFKKLEEPVIG